MLFLLSFLLPSPVSPLTYLPSLYLLRFNRRSKTNHQTHDLLVSTCSRTVYSCLNPYGRKEVIDYVSQEGRGQKLDELLFPTASALLTTGSCTRRTTGMLLTFPASATIFSLTRTTWPHSSHLPFIGYDNADHGLPLL
ncbi:hypothetical protein F5Y17DRAFT_125379 [Xylariaceae sp. FL0594]|nr:hypothetical protein F5Y17DRAFT_125379 [Xylariaceae sp. FL0594]